MKTMKRMMALLLLAVFLLSCTSAVALAEEPKPTVRYNDGAMSGNGLNNIVDGVIDDNAYVSEDSPDLADGKQFFQFEWDAPVSFNKVTLFAKYCGTASKDGQAPTKWKILTSTDGSAYTEVATVTAAWTDSDDMQSQTAEFSGAEAYKFMRVVVLEANLSWNHYAVNEISFEENPALEIGYKDANGTMQYAKAASVTYNNGVMSGNGLQNINDGDYASTYVSETNPDLMGGKQFVQLTWESGVDIDLVGLFAQYCGAEGKDGQAPTEWTIQASKDGTSFYDVATVQQVWAATDDIQSKVVKIALQEDILALRIIINQANLSWGHYVIGEIEAGKAADGYNPEPTPSESEPAIGYVDEFGNTQLAKEAAVTYNEEAMGGLGLKNLIDGNYETTYVSEDDPDMTNQYIQFSWETPISLDMVTLYSQYCGSEGKNGQAPTEWTIQVSTDGETFAEVANVQMKWKGNDQVQSKGVKFDLQENVVALRVVITKANLDWKHYAIGEIEIAQAAEGFDPDKNAMGSSIGYVDDNGVTQFAKDATITYNSGAMFGMGLMNVADGNYETTYVSEDNPDMQVQYIQYTWEEAIDINIVSLYSQYCGTSTRNGQAPTEWEIQVSTDGSTFTKVTDVKSNWVNNDGIQSKSAQFDTQEGVVALRVVIKSANLSWKHYAIGEIEVGNAPEGFVARDLNGGIPATGDALNASVVLLLALSVVGLIACVVLKKRTLA